MMFQVISSVIAVYFSSIVFEVPKRLIKYTALIGGLGWWIYLLFLESAGMELSTYYSGLTVAFLSHIAARFFKAPVTVFFIPGFFPLVPGAGMYRTAYAFLTGDSVKAHYYLSSTIAVAGMIALAIFTVDSLFRLHSIWKKHTKKGSSTNSVGESNLTPN